MAKITIDDVAERSGVSIKTVSRVINNEANVSAKTREKVELAISELNYRPNVSARSLAAGRSFLLGLVYDNLSPAYVTDVQGGVLSACNEAGFNLLIHPCDHQADYLLDELVELAKRSRLDGFLLTPPLSENTSLVAGLADANIAVALITNEFKNTAMPTVHTNNAESAYQLTQFIIQQGHCDIGFIKGHENHDATASRYEGFVRALAEADIKLNSRWVKQGDYSFESGEIAAKKLLLQKKIPTVIFASNDYMAAGVLKAAVKLGVSVPEQLSIVGFDDAPVSHQVCPAITTVRQPVKTMATAAAQMLIATIRGEQLQQLDKQITSEIIVRESVSNKC